MVYTGATCGHEHTPPMASIAPTGFTTWERPTQFGVVGLEPAYFRDTGALRAVIDDSGAGAGTGAGTGAGAVAGAAQQDGASGGGGGTDGGAGEAEAGGASGGGARASGGAQARGRGGARGGARRGKAAAPVREERVVNYAVFERALVPGGDQEWRLTHL